MIETARRLKQNPDLALLADEEALRLLGRSTHQQFDRGDVLFREGEPGDFMLFLDRGDVEVRRGGRQIAALSTGATIGEMALIDPAARSATVVATTDGEAWRLDRDVLWSMLGEGDAAAIKALQGLTATVCARLARVNELVQQEVVRPRGNAFARLWRKVSGRGRH